MTTPDSGSNLTPPPPIPAGGSPVQALNDRAREILRHIVETYVGSGEAVGSRTLSRMGDVDLSPATIRNVMADLEDAGLLYARHTSAGRLPTDAGLRMFVDGLLEVGRLSEDERERIEAQCAANGRSVEQVLRQASQSLAGLSEQVGLVVAPQSESALQHIEFVSLGPGRALVVMVLRNGVIENRIIDVPVGMPSSALVEASNYLTARLIGKTLGEARGAVTAELARDRAQLDALTGDLVERGLAVWSGTEAAAAGQGALNVRGQSKLLEDVTAIDDLERVRRLFSALERKETLLRLLDLSSAAQGVRIFIGAENELFRNAGCSLIISPYKNADEMVVGAIGVIGPDPHELRPDHSDGGLYGDRRRPADRLDTRLDTRRCRRRASAGEMSCTP